jgi:hypothetical protein
MRTFMVIAPDGRRMRVSLPSELEAEAMREAGMTIVRLYWSRTPQRFVTIPEE